MAYPRPPSQQSRSAWNEPEEELAPAAMESEMYVEGGVQVLGEQIDKKQQRGRIKEQQPESGCLASFSRGVRGLWATRMTENTEGDRELYVKTTLLTFGMTSTTMFYYTKVMSELFLDTIHPRFASTFRTITTMHDFWNYVDKDGPLMKGLYWESWYNGEKVEEYGYIYYENKLLGVPRLRQLRVHDHSCEVHSDFKNEIKECYDAYAESIEDREEITGIKTSDGNPSKLTAWRYYTEAQLDGSSHEGLVATYGGGGFVQNLKLFKNETVPIIQELKENLWIRRGTRVVFIDFTVYNANINLFCVVRLTVEYPPTGGSLPSWHFRTVKLLRYVSLTDFLIFGCECLFVLFVIYYCIEEAIEIKRHKFGYFKSFWNILDILVLIISWICICFNAYRHFKVIELLEVLLQDPDEFPDFEFLSYWQMQFNNAVAIALFFSWVKVFKYISFNKTMTQLSSTLARCAKDLAGFAVMFFIIFFAFAQLGYLIFGTQIRDFSTFWNAVFTLFRIILGDFNFHELENAHRLLGPAYFLLYVFFVFFVLLNMFLAIINDTYSEVKADLSNQENEFEMADYFKRGYNRMVDRLNLKKDKIVDIQAALQTADIDGDKQVDFEEWRRDLKNRGYAEGEIEAMFAKYDQDGDRVLDDEEQRRMMADLEGQKAQLQRDLEDGDRPKSGLSQFDESDEESGRGSAAGRRRRRGGGGGSGVSFEEFTVLTRRVDRMEHSIGSIVSKIDAVLVKLEAMEKAKMKRRECMGKLLDRITEGEDVQDDERRQQMESMVREELDKWDSELADSTTGPTRNQSSSSARSDRTPRPGSTATPAPYVNASTSSSQPSTSSNSSDAAINNQWPPKYFESAF